MKLRVGVEGGSFLSCEVSEVAWKHDSAQKIKAPGKAPLCNFPNLVQKNPPKQKICTQHLAHSLHSILCPNISNEL